MDWRVTLFFQSGRGYEYVVEAPNFYRAIDIFRERLSSFEQSRNIDIPETSLAKLHNLHDEDGIKHLPQINSMIEAIRAGHEILEPSGIPNIKVLLDEDGGWLLFDGHHSVLAYMATGRQKLADLPHISVRRAGKIGNLSAQDISIVFGDHAPGIENWRHHTINWQASSTEQISHKKQQNMGELFVTVSLSLQLQKKPEQE